MSDKLKEFELIRTTTTYERRFVMATDWEEAETKGHEEEADWDMYDSRQEVDVEEVQILVNPG